MHVRINVFTCPQMCPWVESRSTLWVGLGGALQPRSYDTSDGSILVDSLSSPSPTLHAYPSSSLLPSLKDGGVGGHIVAVVSASIAQHCKNEGLQKDLQDLTSLDLQLPSCYFDGEGKNGVGSTQKFVPSKNIRPVTNNKSTENINKK